MPFPLRDTRKNPRSMYARVPQAMAQFVLKIEKLSHIMGPTPIVEMARAYGLHSRLWFLLEQCFKVLSFRQLTMHGKIWEGCQPVHYYANQCICKVVEEIAKNITINEQVNK